VATAKPPNALKTNWRSLKHALGPATKGPDLVKDVVGAKAQTRIESYDMLRGALVGEGQWFDASAPAASLLLDPVAGASEPHVLLMLVADILGADHARVGFRRGVGRGPGARREVTERKRAVFDALEESGSAALPWARAAVPAWTGRQRVRELVGLAGVSGLGPARLLRLARLTSRMWAAARRAQGHL